MDASRGNSGKEPKLH